MIFQYISMQKKEPTEVGSLYIYMAESVGFEPTIER